MPELAIPAILLFFIVATHHLVYCCDILLFLIGKTHLFLPATNTTTFCLLLLQKENHFLAELGARIICPKMRR
jgi:hypothetical protein